MMPMNKVWTVDVSFTVCVCVFFVCVFVRLRIFPPRIKLASSNFARPFIGIQGRESTISVNFAPPEAKNRTNRRSQRLPFGSRIHDRAACGRGIGMCGYTSVPYVGLTYLINYLILAAVI